MKILYKFIKITGLIILSLILFMMITVVVAKIYEDKLASFTIEKLETEINAPMSIGKVSLNPLFSFPRLTAEINQLYIGEPQSQNSDTLFFINSLKVGLNSWDLMFGIYTIDKLEIAGLDFEYIIDKNGRSNIDFLLNESIDSNNENTEDTLTSGLDFSAERFNLENIHINYYDSITDIGSQITIPEITIKAKTNNNYYNGKANGSFTLSHCQFEDTKVDQMESCKLAFDLEFENNETIINQLNINSEGIVLRIMGTVSNNDDIGIDAVIDAYTLDLNILKKYAPEEYISLVQNTSLPQIEPIRLDLKANYNDEKLELNKLALESNGIYLGVKGVFNYMDTITVDAIIESLRLDLNVIENYLPSGYMKQYGILDIEGILDISGTIKGDMADSTMIPVVDAQVNLNNIKILSIDYPQIDTLKLRAHINTGQKMDMSEASIHIEHHELISPLSHIQMVGSLSDFHNPNYHINSISYLNAAEFENLIPDDFAKSMNGNIVAEINTKGIIPEKYSDDFIDDIMDNSTISLQFKEFSAILFDSIPIEHFSSQINYTPHKSKTKEIQIEQLSLKSEAFNINLNNSSLSTLLNGKLSDPIHMGAQINSFIIQNGGNKLTGSGEINNFESPEFKIKTNVTLQFDELMPFVPDSMVKDMSGLAHAYITSQGKVNLDSLDSQLMHILFEKSSFDLKLNNIAMTFPDSTMNMNGISAQIHLENDSLSINHFSANYNGLQLGTDSSKIINLYKAVLLNQEKELYVHSNIKVGDFYLDDFKHLMNLGNSEAEKHSQENTPQEKQNWTYLIHGSASVNSVIIDSMLLDDFNIHRLHIHDMSSLFKFTDSSYILDQFNFKVFEGEMSNSVHYKLRKDGTQSVSTHNVVSNMNMQTLLQDMDNFGMDSLITYDNISGLLSVDINTFVPIDDSVRIDKMMISGDLKLEQGGVYNYPPAQEISKFTSIKELDNIQFKTLRSNIFMFKNKLYVPRTDIVSNAMDIAAFGMQSLEGDSEYHMEMHLSNILFGKSQKRNKKQNESGEEIDKKSLKKSSRKIRYAVTDGKSKVGLDSKDSRDDMMNKIRVQKKMLDFIFFPKNIHYNTKPE
ncbi:MULTISPECIES: AsmA family protein [unclassified Lentimicrobium]|uniref:AsmA family protein n=1 Tax=unclassified Lentimicrobium TaxID=2677434 RepID=UPI001553B433|nr:MULTISPECIES: AsmA family protein [unclassified Lentimicrobium]NPD47468.1 AsmA family protein [Lentimicrobium sp. S6]NPD86858.1 AsmA family protein [Lentimicrobium sp. L6]